MNTFASLAARNHAGVAGPLVVIMSGVPGSGKSTYARSIAAAIGATYTKIVSADDYFTKPDGTYDFHARDLPAAHAACLRAFNGALRDMRSSRDLLVVDNTNTTAVEIAPYYALSVAYGNAVHIVTLECDPTVAAARNTHDVSLASIERMAGQIRDRKLPPYWLASLFTLATETDMDPNEALRKIRAAVREIRSIDDMSDDELTKAELPRYLEAADSLVELVEALDNWIAKGGFLPDAWRKP